MKNNYETWKRIANKLAKIDPDNEPTLVAQLMINQENFIKKNKTILDVARENFKKRKKNNARCTTSKRNRK